jgi:hypothetical protein
MKPRSPVLGYNHNVRYAGRLWHVQTEDSGVQNPHVFTHLFHNGTILATKRGDYDPAAEVSAVQKLMQAQHKAVLKELKSGSYDEKISKYFGEPVVHIPDDTTAPGAPKPIVPEEPDTVEEPPVPLAPAAGADVGRAATMLAVPRTDPELPSITAQEGFPDEAATIAGVGEVADTTPPPHPFRDTDPNAAPDRRPPPSTERAPTRGPREDLGQSRRQTGQHQKPPSSPTVPRRPVSSPAVTRPPPGRPPVGRPGGPGGPGYVPRAPTAGSNTGRRPSQPYVAKPTAEGVVVARPAVIIGGDQRGGRRPESAKPAPQPAQPENIFGGDLISEKSLDEVILAYLSEDLTEK